MLGGLFWGYIADKWHCHKAVILATCLLSIFAITSQPFIGLSYGDPKTNKCPVTADFSRGNDTAQQFDGRYLGNQSGVNNWTTKSTKMLLNGSEVFQTHASTQNLEESRYGALFVIMLLIYIVVTFSEAGGFPFIDAGTLRRSQLATTDRPIDYGRQRMFGSLGAAFGIITTNLAVDYFPPNEHITCYAGIFVAYALYTCLGLKKKSHSVV